MEKERKKCHLEIIYIFFQSRTEKSKLHTERTFKRDKKKRKKNLRKTVFQGKK